MATAAANRRVQHLLTMNRTWWQADVKRHDPGAPAAAMNRYFKRKQDSIAKGLGGVNRRTVLSRAISSRVVERNDPRNGRMLASSFNSDISNNSSVQMYGTHWAIRPGSIGGKWERRSKALVSDYYVPNQENESISQDYVLRSHQNVLRDSGIVSANPLRQEKPPQEQPSQQGGKGVDGKPSADQLLKVYNKLQQTLPSLFTQPMDYTMYRQDLIFVNNLINKTTTGLYKYVQQVALLRTVGHIKFAFVRFELISMGQDLEEGRITVRWRIAGISALKVMLKFWKFRLWKYEEIMKQQSVWYDGISYFDVGGDGHIYRHIADKVEEDKDRALDDKRRQKASLIAKLAVMSSLLHPTNLPIHEAVAFQSSCSSEDSGCVDVDPTVSSVSKTNFSLQSS